MAECGKIFNYDNIEEYSAMFIHFAFARFKDNPDEQINELINKILNSKRLIFRENPEFIPVFQPHIHPRFKDKTVFHIPLESFKRTEKGTVASSDDLRFIHPKNDIHFLQCDVGMICFIKIAFKQLKRSGHQYEYGKLGLVFNEKFLRKKGIKPVQYYMEESLFNDPLILKWNLNFAYRPNLSSDELEKKRELETQIFAYRKPATLFDSFSESRRLAIERAESETEIKIEDVYDRYPIGYDFQAEKEWRIVSYHEEYLEFTENDLFSIIVPNKKSESNLQEYLGSEWKKVPEIRTFP